MWTILKEVEIPDHLTCLLEICIQVKKQQWELDMEQQTGSKFGRECYILSLCLFNFCAEYIMWNARLDEALSRVKIAGRSINNLSYADDTTLMTESEEKLKSLLMRGERREWKNLA